MRLTDKQIEFTRTMAYFQVWCIEQELLIVEAEAYRPPEMAKIYAKRGTGIINSTHTKKLARDILLFSPAGKFLQGIEDYRVMGDKWKSMHHFARWGGDFKRRDAFHFSFMHNGVS